jgi:hypothetical protein
LELTEEEKKRHAEIGREYNRQMFIRRNQEDKDLTNKIWLQQEAIRALPPTLRAHAQTIDNSDPPSDRPWPLFDTPPIKDFDYRQYIEEETEEVEEVQAKAGVKV